MYKSVTVGAITTIGKKHISRNTPCEDASYAVSDKGVSVVCIADGAGGKQYTDARFGSDAAVHVITDTLVEHFDALYEENREAAVRGYLMAKLRIAFADIMKERNIDVIDRLSCTLLFVAVKDRRMLIGHIGDGLIVRISPSGVSPISMPQNDKAGKTYFVTAAHADNYMRLLKTTTDDVHAIALMTDGVQDSVYNEDTGLVKPVVAKLAETFAKGREEGEKEVLGTVEKYIVGSSNASDDASFGVMYFEGTKAPDTEGMDTSADKFGTSDETFKDLSVAIKPELVKAHSIITGCKTDEEPEERPEEPKQPEEVKEAKDNNEHKKGNSTKVFVGINIALSIVLIILIIILGTHLFG
ncbi:MAG: protein phosphatase 2C domain-containing protein [Saccharofermentans sp.]|nr:protein phosphatase 2C domain-containing protein [Saccharofermentans sp.]